MSVGWCLLMTGDSLLLIPHTCSHVYTCLIDDHNRYAMRYAVKELGVVQYECYLLKLRPLHKALRIVYTYVRYGEHYNTISSPQAKMLLVSATKTTNCRVHVYFLNAVTHSVVHHDSYTCKYKKMLLNYYQG